MIDPLTPTLPPPFSTLSLISTRLVPNEHPTIEVPYKLAVVGEAPGEDEENHGRPFIGPSGRFLDSILSTTGILRQGCLVANVCQYRPPGNDIAAFGFDGKTKFGNEKVQAGWEQLKHDLVTFKPNAILALGNTPLYFLCGRTGINSWRGSILSSPYGKVIPAVHPAAILREYKGWPLLRFDAYRARVEAEKPELELPKRLLETDLSAYEICNRLDNWPAGQLLSFDIEGGLDAFPCCSVAGESNRGFIIAWAKHSEHEQGRIAVSLSRALYSTAIPKVLQNSLYDRFVLAYGYSMLIRNVVEDTMDKSWAIYPELKKSLGTIASIWTREPYYKFEGGRGNKGKIREDEKEAQETYYRYCIKDSCVTLEASLAMDQALNNSELRHYKFNVQLKNPLLYMQLKGFNYDSTLAQQELENVKQQLTACADRIESQISPMQFTKKEFSNRIRGEKGSIGDKRLAMVLYQQKGYPVQKKGRGADARVSCDVEALLTLKKKNPHDTFLADILLHRKLESTQETLEWKVDPKDGRAKCCYNQFSKGTDSTEEGGGATDTGRLRCSKSIIPVDDDTVGGNFQTVTKKLRKLYRADEGKFLFQCDLAGADGWTVAAHCMKHGDSTMWDDYSYGLKPALIIALLYQGMATNNTSREDLLRLSKAYKEWEAEHEDEAWIYFGCKRIQHASNYGVQARTGTAQIMKDSYKLTGKPIYMPEHEFNTLQRLYFVRYSGLYAWHNWAKKEVSDGKNLTSASGHTRTFFGRRKSWDTKSRTFAADHDTWKEFLADEPQENTTYATNLALHRLWHDLENRIGVVDESTNRSNFRPRTLIIEPLHQVHDALIGQFPRERAAWAVEKIRSYFDNELEIANVKVKIPFEGNYGPSWGELGTKYGGGEI